MDNKELISTANIGEFSKASYLDYSMYVILDRAIPHIADGLKPVQRRIIYAMYELALSPASKPKKSARTIGDVLGKYHPHGDAACYEAMVLLAQSFTMRYPLIKGQGNFGSITDPKAFAAMRYTEATLAEFSKSLLQDLNEATVQWNDNFDSSMLEPKVLAARLPNILLNGASGIAVGMVTNIPSHNLFELSDALELLITNNKVKEDEILDLIPGPDLPTGGIIVTPKSELRNIYKTGSGTFKVRSVWEMEGKNIVISALPYQTSNTKIMEQIGQLMQTKKLDGLNDLRDESDHESPVRIILEPKKSVTDIKQLMEFLFACTDLEKTIKVNLNVVGLDGRPQVKSIVQILKEWLEFRCDFLRKNLAFKLLKTEKRLHIVSGLSVALCAIEQVIAIIKDSDDPKQDLIDCLQIDEIQANAILDLRIRQLAKLEKINLEDELANLTKDADNLRKILKSNVRFNKYLLDEIKADTKLYATHRQTRFSTVITSSSNDFKMHVLDNISVILSRHGWIKQAKGHDIEKLEQSSNFKTGDSLLSILATDTHSRIMIFTSAGRSFLIDCNKLPSARGYGEPLSIFLDLQAGSTPVGLLPESAIKVFLIASNAKFVINDADNFKTKLRSGKKAMTISRGHKLLIAKHDITKYDFIVLVTLKLRLALISVDDIQDCVNQRAQNIIKMPNSDSIISCNFIKKSNLINLDHNDKKIAIKWSSLQEYSQEPFCTAKLLSKALKNSFE